MPVQRRISLGNLPPAVPAVLSQPAPIQRVRARPATDIALREPAPAPVAPPAAPVQPVANPRAVPGNNLPSPALDAARVQMTEVARALIIDFWQKNTEANALVAQAKKAKTMLETHMAQHGLTDIDAVVTMLGKTATVDATVTDVEEEFVDVAKLQTKVTPEQFMQIVKAGKEDATKIAGTNAMSASLSTRTKIGVFSVKARK